MVEGQTAYSNKLNVVRKGTTENLLQECARIITSTLDIEAVYEQFALQLKGLVPLDRVYLNVLDQSTGTYHLKILWESGRLDIQRSAAHSPDYTQTQEVMNTGQMLVRQDLAQDIRFVDDQQNLDDGLRSSIALPLIAKGKTIGTMGLRSRTVNAYGPKEQELLKRLADLIAPSIENASLYQRLQEQTKEIALVDEVARIITSTLDIDEVYEKFAQELRKLVDFDRAFVTIADEDAGTYVIKYVAGEPQPERLPGQVKPLEGSHTQYVMNLGHAFIRADVSKNALFRADSEQVDLNLFSSIAVPLVSNGKPIGIMGLRGRGIGSYGARERVILERLASQIAPAVENAGLYQQRKASEEFERLRNQQIEALYGIASLLVAPGIFEDKCNEILRVMSSVAQADAATIRVVSEDSMSLPVIATHSQESMNPYPPVTISYGEGGAGMALLMGTPYVINDYQRSEIGTTRGKLRGIRSSVALSVNVAGKPIGVINVISYVEGHFTPERVRLLEAIADGLGMLLENSRLAEDLRSTTEERAVVDEVARMITSTLDIDQVCESFTREMRKLVNFEQASICMIERDLEVFTLRYIFGERRRNTPIGAITPLAGSITEELLNAGQTIIRSDIAVDSSFSDDQTYLDLGLCSCIAVPLITKGMVIGSMILRSCNPGAYGSREQAILERLAMHIAPAIENARLYVEAKNEKELATRTSAQLKAVLEGVDTGILLVGNNQETLWANQRYGELFGIEDVDKLAFTHPHRDDRQKILRRAFDDPDSIFDERTQIYADPGFTGPTKEIELVYPRDSVLQPFTTPVYNDQGESVGRMWVYHDVTGAKAAEEQLLQFQKMESIGRLAGGIAHDFNNLLTAIMGYSQLAMAEAPSNDLLVSHVQEIQRASERAANLTGQLLAFSRRQVIEPRVIDLNALILELDGLLRRLIGEDIELVTLPAWEIGRVEVDPSQLEQVIINLVINARDAMPNGGKLVIETSMESLNPDSDLQQTGDFPSPYIVLSVSDTGTGMDEDVKLHLFEPFYTTKPVGKGTGLGLATCYGIVKQSGGEIEVLSELGQGTCVKVYLPSSTSEVSGTPVNRQWQHNSGGTETVLLAEDDMLVRCMVADVLRDQGYNVLLAGNGEEAIRLAQEQEGQPIDLLLTDLAMPQMGGLELANRISEMRPDTKIIFTSGYTDDPFFTDGGPNSQVEFIQKPFVPAELSMKVRDVLDRVG